MADTKLIYNSALNVDIGVPVVTYNDDQRYSFYHVAGGRRFTRPFNDRRGDVNQVILHHDGMSNSAGCFNVLANRRLSTHLMINHDGVVYQPLALADVAWHAHPQNTNSIGIDLNNPIRRNRMRPGQASREMFRGRINGSVKTSLGYTDAQYQSLIAVLNGLCRIFPQLQTNRRAPIGPNGKVVRRKLIETSYAGVVGHFHVSANKWDPGPGFDWERVLIGLRGNQIYFPVTLPNTVNLAHVPKARALEAAEPYFDHIEQGRVGGYYPVGLNQAWHTGVHLEVPLGTPLLAPADGEVVAALNVEEEAQGSPNVVVIRHKAKVGATQAGFFTVLQHVQKQPLDNPRVEWIRRFAAQDGPEGLPSGSETSAAPGFVALASGRVALGKVKVKAGEVVAYSGRFNPSLTRGTPQPMVDVGLITSAPMFPSNDPTFELVKDDDDPTLLCTSRAVWKRVTKERDALRGLVEGSYPLDAAEMRAFFSRNPNAKAMRWLCVKHPLEYSESTDFSFVFGPRLDFEWSARKEARQQLKRMRKFLWWDAAVSDYLKIGKSGQIMAYHPFALLSVLAMGEARKALEIDEEGGVRTYDDKALAEERRKDSQAEAQFAEQYGSEGHRHSNFQAADTGESRDVDAEAERAPDPGGWLRWEQGEWEPDEE